MPSFWRPFVSPLCRFFSRLEPDEPKKVVFLYSLFLTYFLVLRTTPVKQTLVTWVSDCWGVSLVPSLTPSTPYSLLRFLKTRNKTSCPGVRLSLQRNGHWLRTRGKSWRNWRKLESETLESKIQSVALRLDIDVSEMKTRHRYPTQNRGKSKTQIFLKCFEQNTIKRNGLWTVINLAIKSRNSNKCFPSRSRLPNAFLWLMKNRVDTGQDRKQQSPFSQLFTLLERVFQDATFLTLP